MLQRNCTYEETMFLFYNIGKKCKECLKCFIIVLKTKKTWILQILINTVRLEDAKRKNPSNA